MGFLHSFTTGSTVDGPGVRVVAWTAGCNWRCRYCHNPDTWSLINGMPVPLDRAVDELRKYRRGLQVMSGGLTVSGGEPLLQDRFVGTAVCGGQGHGSAHGHRDQRLASVAVSPTRTWIRSISSSSASSPGARRIWISPAKDIGPTLDFARRLAARKLPVWVRFVLVPGLTDDKEVVGPIAKFAASLGNVQRVEVLPFHQMGRFKWEKLGLDYTLDRSKAPSDELVEATCDIFRAEGLQAF